jgi:hypothetical protein
VQKKSEIDFVDEHRGILSFRWVPTRKIVNNQRIVLFMGTPL